MERLLSGFEILTYSCSMSLAIINATHIMAHNGQNGTIHSAMQPAMSMIRVGRYFSSSS